MEDILFLGETVVVSCEISADSIVYAYKDGKLFAFLMKNPCFVDIFFA